MLLLWFFIKETDDSESCECTNRENDTKERTEIGGTEVKHKKSVDNDGFFYELIVEFHLIDFGYILLFIIMLFSNEFFFLIIK